MSEMPKTEWYFYARVGNEVIAMKGSGDALGAAQAFVGFRQACATAIVAPLYARRHELEIEIKHATSEMARQRAVRRFKRVGASLSRETPEP